MADVTHGQTAVYRKQGGNELVVASGGRITVEAGGQILASGGGSVVLNDRADVTQETGITTAVAANGLHGTITTVSQTIAGGAEATFTVNNSRVAAGDVVVVCLKSTTSAGGPFFVAVTAVAAGSFAISITNTHASTAGNNTLVINYAVLKVAA
jgi:hypothetical protein